MLHSCSFFLRIVKLATLLLSVGVMAQGGSITFDGFSMATNGNAALTGSGNLQLIPDDLGAGVPGDFKDGSAYVTTPFAISAGTPFGATFTYLMTNSDSSRLRKNGCSGLSL
jgi:hypothetical protein